MAEEKEQIKDKKQLLDALAKIGEIQEECFSIYSKEAEGYWDSLTYDQKLMCFYVVTKKIHQGDCVENRSYRGVLYDTFGFDADSYGLGMDSGYFEIHNHIISKEQIQRYNKLEDILKSEELSKVIDELNYLRK
jgi:hypothetical protein